MAANPGTLNVQLRLFGVIPVKNMVMNVVPQHQVIPGGQSIGVMLKSKGILVVGYSAMEGRKGQSNPAKDAGLKVGDIIVSANGREINSEKGIAKIIDDAGQRGTPVVLKIKRGGRTSNVKIKPEYCDETLRYRVGLYIRDNTAGVGTMTFYEPESRVYGALGHVVSSGSEQRIDIKDGRIVEANIQGINQGKKGHPGEKIGIFLDNGNIDGKINKNTVYGIFGQLAKPIRGDFFYDRPVSVAYANQIKEGPAKILTVVNGNKIDQFDIQILKIMPHQQANGKGLVIKITDKELIDLTGGIVQGMSGSPIIQDGKLIGAVTHVFVNDPTQGYGVLAEWMLWESGLLNENSSGDIAEAGVIHVDFPGFLSYFN